MDEMAKTATECGGTIGAITLQERITQRRKEAEERATDLKRLEQLFQENPALQEVVALMHRTNIR